MTPPLFHRRRRKSAISVTGFLLVLLLLSHGDAFTSLPAFSNFPKKNHQIRYRIATTSLGVSSSAATDRQSASVKNTTAEDSTSSSSSTDEHLNDDDESPYMPWSDFQEWALRDHLPHYLVSISTDNPTRNKKEEVYALWRTMTREVTELSGYSIESLVKMQERQVQQNKTELMLVPKVLPMLDEFEFSTSGGLSGRVYGIPGLADGSKVETSSVVNVQTTVPKGYVQTKDGSVAYELGLPLREDLLYSLDGSTRRARALSRSAVETAAGLAQGVACTTQQEDPDAMLVRLGASTAVLLAGATAVNMLSHHLTVNVFWV